MIRQAILTTLLIGITAGTSLAGRENSRHTMAGGDFGVAYIHNGDIYISDGDHKSTVQVSGKNATRVIAADITGTSDDELVFLSGGGIYYVDINAGTTNGGHRQSV